MIRKGKRETDQRGRGKRGKGNKRNGEEGMRKRLSALLTVYPVTLFPSYFFPFR